MGHLDLTMPVRMGWHEGFQIYAEGGTVLGRTDILGTSGRARSSAFLQRTARHGRSTARMPTSIRCSSKDSPTRSCMEHRSTVRQPRTVRTSCAH